MAVYFVQCAESKLIKIGSSLRPFARIRGLQTGCPGDLAILKIIDGDQSLEFSLHERFSGERSRGEWFRPSPELLAAIEEYPESDATKDEEPSYRYERTTSGPKNPIALPYLEQPQINRPIIDAILESHGSYTEIASYHGVSKQRVFQIAARMKLDGIEIPPRIRQRKDYLSKESEIAASLTQSSDSFEIIAWQFDVPMSRVMRIAKRLRNEGIEVIPRVKDRPINPRRLAIEREITESSAPFGEIAARHGLTTGRICHIAKALRDCGVEFPKRYKFGRSPRDQADIDIERQSIEEDIIGSLMTFAEIAKKQGCWPNLVTDIARDLQERGIDFPKRVAFSRPIRPIHATGEFFRLSREHKQACGKQTQGRLFE